MVVAVSGDGSGGGGSGPLEWRRWGWRQGQSIEARLAALLSAMSLRTIAIAAVADTLLLT